jgi:hypothetical protein
LKIALAFYSLSNSATTMTDANYSLSFILLENYNSTGKMLILSLLLLLLLLSFYNDK